MYLFGLCERGHTGSGVGARHDTGRGSHVNPDHLFGIGKPQMRGNARAPVPALRGKPGVAQFVTHELDPQVPYLGRVHAPFVGHRRKPISRHGRDYNVERVFRASTVIYRVGQWLDNLEDFEDCAGPTVGDDQRYRVGPLPPLVDEMDVQSLDVSREVGKPVDGLFLGAPIKLGAPILHQLLYVVQIRAVVPTRPRDLIGPPGAGQPVFQVLEYGIRDMDLVGLYSHVRWPPLFGG